MARLCLPGWYSEVAQAAQQSTRFSSGCAVDADGDIPCLPDSMRSDAAAQLGHDIPLDVYTLARVIHSEYGDGSPFEKIAIAEATINEARRNGKGLTDYTYGLRGSYGRQGRGGRPVSTALDPIMADILIADYVLAGRSNDFTRGASIYFDPDAADASGGATRDARSIAEKWTNEGFVWVGPLPGVNSRKLMLFRWDPASAKDEKDRAIAELYNPTYVPITNLASCGPGFSTLFWAILIGGSALWLGWRLFTARKRLSHARTA